MSNSNDALYMGAASVINTGVNAFAQGDLNRRTRKWNEEQMAKQRQWALDDWEKTNTYNSPRAYMQRLQEAGLNPALMYGNGVIADKTDAPKSTSSPSWSPKAPELNLAPALSGFYDVKQRQAQLDIAGQTLENMRVDNKLKVLQAEKDGLRVEGMKNDLKWSAEDRPYKQQDQIQKTHMTAINYDLMQATKNSNLETALAENAEKIAKSGTSHLTQKEIQSRINNLKANTKNIQQDTELKNLGNLYKAMSIDKDTNGALKVLTILLDLLLK